MVLEGLGAAEEVPCLQTALPDARHIIPRAYGRNCLTAFARTVDGFSRFFVRRASALGFALVPQLLAFGQREFDFYSAVLEVHPGGNESQTLLLGLADQLADFFLVYQQLASAQRCVVENVTMVVGADVAVQQPEFAILEQAV